MLTKAENKRLKKFRVRWNQTGRLTHKEENEVRLLIDKKKTAVQKHVLNFAIFFALFGAAIITASLVFYFSEQTTKNLIVASLTSVFGLYVFFSALTKIN